MNSIFNNNIKYFQEMKLLHRLNMLKLFYWNVGRQSIYILCLSVCLYPINVKTAVPIGPKFCVEPHVTPGNVYEWSKFKSYASIKIRFSLNFWKFWKSTKVFNEIRKLFFVLFYNVHKKNMFTIKIEDGREAPLILVL